MRKEVPPQTLFGICVIETRRCAGDETIVIPPVERDPGQILKRLILDVRGLLKLLVVVDAEGPDSSSNRSPGRRLAD